MESDKDNKKMIHTCEISDSFVSHNMKLRKETGKVGNGEARLFISNSKEITNKFINKDGVENLLKVEFDENYINDNEEFLKNDNNFNRINLNRYSSFKENIQKLNNCLIPIKIQNGDDDVSRNYIGTNPHRSAKDKTAADKDNIKLWDTLRETLVPTKTTIEFYKEDTYTLVFVRHNNSVHKYNKPSGCSFVSMEFLNTFGKINNIEIQHAMNKGEYKVKQTNGYFSPVDGYHNCSIHRCDGTHEKPCIWHNFVFEFQGTYWHKNKKEKDFAKKQFWIENGYHWFEISETEWTNRKKIMKRLDKN